MSLTKVRQSSHASTYNVLCGNTSNISQTNWMGAWDEDDSQGFWRPKSQQKGNMNKKSELANEWNDEGVPKLVKVNQMQIG